MPDGSRHGGNGVTTEYTPTMDELVDGYRAMRARDAGRVEPHDRILLSIEAVAEAKRALAARDREVAEKAWDEGYQRGLDTQYGTATPTGKPYDPDPNPYRLEQSNV